LKAHRGLTVVTVLIVLAVAGAIFWFLTYGEAYWDNLEVKHLTRTAANMCYQERDPVVQEVRPARQRNLSPSGCSDPDDRTGGKSRCARRARRRPSKSIFRHGDHLRVLHPLVEQVVHLAEDVLLDDPGVALLVAHVGGRPVRCFTSRLSQYASP